MSVCSKTKRAPSVSSVEILICSGRMPQIFLEAVPAIGYVESLLHPHISSSDSTASGSSATPPYPGPRARRAAAAAKRIDTMSRRARRRPSPVGSPLHFGLVAGERLPSVLDGAAFDCQL